MKPIYDSLKRLVAAGRLTASDVGKAVARGWITPDEFAEITGEAYADDMQ